jgi:uncharacterized membrane protein HdeD (DUF308 family)
MVDYTWRQGTQSDGPGDAPERNAMCPMATMCERLMNRPHSGIGPFVAGIMLIVIGALILVEPRILVWLGGAALVLFGFMLLMLARFIR